MPHALDEMTPPGSRGVQEGKREVRRRRRGVDCEPFAQDVEREVRRRRRGVDCEPFAQDVEREARRKRRRVDRKPRARGGESVERSQIETTGSARAALEEEEEEEEVSRGFSPSSPNVPVSDVEDICDEMADRFITLMADHAANGPLYAEQVRRESVDCHNVTVEDEFCDVDDGSFRSCKARKVAVLASKSVVSLSSFSDEKRIRVCSGFVIGYDPSTKISKILTSATLVRSLSTRNILIPHVKVMVGLPNGHVCDGSVSMVDFHYNLAVVEVRSTKKLPEVILVNAVMKKGEVLAIGRFYDHGGVMCAKGKIRKQASSFDCPELLVSSCHTTMAGVGGPLVDYHGQVVGINFYGENHTPFLSSAVIIRCLDHWMSYGRILRPWLGFIYTPVDMLPLRVLEKCTYVAQGFYISKVTKGSPADVAGLCVGDVIIECAGEDLTTAPELGTLLLDLCKKQIQSYTLEGNLTVEVVVRKQKDGRKARKKMIANVLNNCNYYSWIDPSPSYNDNNMASMQIFKS